MRKHWLGCILAAILLSSGAIFAAAAEKTGAEPVKYVFLFIGDGMSLPQRMLVEEYLKRTGHEGLKMNAMASQGMSTTYAADSFITDSAAAGTAIATGSKTNFGMLGVDPAGKPLESVAEVAHRNGRKVGIISSVSLDHATPAAFYAHVTARGDYYSIATQLTDTPYEFFGGGGFLGQTAKGQPDIFAVAKAKKFTVATDKAQFDAITPATPGPVLAISPRLADSKAMPYSIDLAPGEVTLADITAKAIEYLDGDRGFFLMVEGGKIDWVCHANDAATAIRETIAFDDAIRQACTFAQKHPDDTLIVVTGDHETGGLTLGFAGTHYKSYLERLQHQKISTTAFSDLVKQWQKAGDMTPEAAQPAITANFGLKFTGAADDPMVLNSEEQERVKTAFLRSMGDNRYAPGENKELLYGGYDPLSVTLTHILNNKAGVAWTSYSHTALPVATSAMGKNAAAFAGMGDNTDIANRLKPMLDQLP